MSPETGLRRESQHRVPHALVRSQLETVLASELFSRSERLSGFLRFVVEETLNGRGETLKELVLAHQLYGKEADFDGAISPIVRVDARRLRDKLREYYANRPSDPVVISLPKGSYVPTFERFGGTTSVSDVKTVAAEAAPPDSVSPPPPPSGAATSSRWQARIWRVAALAGVIAVVLAGAYAYSRRITQSTTPAGRIMLAVLPFQNLTGDPDQEYLCDGLTEEMIAILGGVDSSRLGIIARTSAMHYKNTTKRADEIGRTWASAFYSKRASDEPAIAPESRRSSSRSRLKVTCGWNSSERNVQDVLALQREVAATIAQRTIASLGMPLKDLAFSADRQSDNSLAYQHYLRGRYQLSKATIEGLRKAQDHFQKAIDLDPSYARAFSGLADTYALLGSYDIMPINESHPLGRKAAMRALALDESIGEAHGHSRRSLPITTGIGTKSSVTTSARLRSTRTT